MHTVWYEIIWERCRHARTEADIEVHGLAHAGYSCKTHWQNSKTASGFFPHSETQWIIGEREQRGARWERQGFHGMSLCSRFFLMRSRKPKMPTSLLTHTNKSHHVELCGAIWNTHECASHLPAHGSRALFLPAMRRPGFLPSPLRAQLRCPQTTFENLRESCRIRQNIL